MKMILEEKLYAFSGADADENIALARLETGVYILIHEDGTATGMDGKRYVRICRETPIKRTRLGPDYFDELEEYMDSEWENLGWTTDADETIVLQGDPQ